MKYQVYEYEYKHRGRKLQDSENASQTHTPVRRLGSAIHAKRTEYEKQNMRVG